MKITTIALFLFVLVSSVYSGSIQYVPPNSSGGGASAATTTSIGTLKVSTTPVDATSPIAVGNNDNRLSGAPFVPITGAISANQIFFSNPSTVASGSSEMTYVASHSQTAPVEVSFITGLSGAYGVAYYSNKAVVVGPGYLKVYDLTTPSSPSLLGTLSDGGGSAPYLGNPQRIVVFAPYAYIIDTQYNALEIVDLTNPANPVHMGSLLDGGGSAPYLNQPEGIALSPEGDVVYIASQISDRLEIIIVGDPSDPAHIGSIGSLGGPTSVAIQGNYAYVTAHDADRLRVINISAAYAPVLTGSGSGVVAPYKVVVSGNYAYVTDISGMKLSTFDVSTPASPTLGSQLSSGGSSAPYLDNVYGMILSGSYIYANSLTANAVEVVSIAAPATPVHVSSVVNGSGSSHLVSPLGIAIGGNYVNYVLSAAAGSNALSVIEVAKPAAIALNGAIDIGTHIVSGVSTPVASSDAANKAYVDAVGTDTPTEFSIPRTGSNTTLDRDWIPSLSSLYLSVDGGTVGGTAFSNLSPGHIPYTSETNILVESENLTFDGTNVSGVTPTSSAHLATKGYCDSVSAPVYVDTYGTTATSGSFTWTKRAGVKVVTIIAFGGGGAGANGNGGIAGANQFGGTAGGGGSRIMKVFDATSLGSTESVVIGAGGVAGYGNSGSGGITTFGTAASYVKAGGGGGGYSSASGDESGGAGGGEVTSGAVGSGGNGTGGGTYGASGSNNGFANGGAGAPKAAHGYQAESGGASGGGVSGSGTNGYDGGSSFSGGAGGGSGATGGLVQGDGGDGGTFLSITTAGGALGATTNGAAGSNGANAPNWSCGGQGGGGGAGDVIAPGGAGGNGGWPAGGGGGGAGGLTTGGVGGAGGNGAMMVISQ